MPATLKRLDMNDQLVDYLHAVSLREPEILARLRAETDAQPYQNIQISALQGQFMALLIQLHDARKCLEVGTFTGYSALTVALALPEDGRIVACDVSEEFTAIGRKYWAEAGVAHKVDLRIAPAVATLDALLANHEACSYDFAFIDADKSNYDAYYERALQLVRPGGLIAIDNTLWSGKVADPAHTDADTGALRALNAKLHADARIHLSLLPLADGLTLCLKK